MCSAFSLESELLRIRATITYSSIFSEVCMLQASNFVALNIKVIQTCRQNYLVVLWVFLWLQVMELGASRLNFDLFKPAKEKLFIYISITLNIDMV